MKRDRRRVGIVRKDGRCRACLGERPARAILHDDPFCSGDCCRSAHGVATSYESPNRAKGGNAATRDRQRNTREVRR